MYKFNKISFIILLLLLGCSSTTMEFASAKTAARSEKDLKRGEEWGLKALNIPSDNANALVPYFLATEIYKPQEKWDKMAEMLDEAIRRNPEQKLEKPKLLVPPEELTKENYDEMVIETIAEGVQAYREDAWAINFNQAVEAFQSSEEYTKTIPPEMTISFNEIMKMTLLYKQAKKGSDIATMQLINDYSIDVDAMTLEEFVILLDKIISPKEVEIPEKHGKAYFELINLAINKLEICLKIDPERLETYNALVMYYRTSGDIKIAKSYAKQGLDFSETAVLYELYAKLLLDEFENNNDPNLLKEADSIYLKAMDLAADDAKTILRLKKQYVFILIDKNEIAEAINTLDELLNIYYDSADLYFNAGVLYQRLATQVYDDAANLYKLYNEGNTTSEISIEKMYDEFVQARDYALQSKEKFLEANDLDTEDTGSREAAAEMRRLVKQIKEIYIPSVEQMAKNEGVNLN